ncbi:MAG: RnfABCDGE type electron transport complex subunit D, partial [Lentisphaeria bacterium]|nr:RnfABCDGE type electron transport complex subunit D [Lentisphaeria bacterium]
PHVQDGDSVARIMFKVILCLIPVMAASIYFFGFDAIRVLLITTAGCLFFEWLCCLIGRRPNTVFDYSAAVTGVILALNLPPTAPWWLCLCGAFVAIVIAKCVFGGLGQNPFNPAAVARIALLVGFAGPMTKFKDPCLGFMDSHFVSGATGLISGATPLTAAKAATTEEAIAALETSDLLRDYFLGYVGGSLGETSALAILIGGLGLLIMRLITWHIPVAMLGSIMIFSWLVHGFSPDLTPGPLFHLTTGGVMIGAFFMATDMVTSPMTKKGKLIFGALIGVLTCIIRIWGGYPEGVSFSIVIMNALVPLIDRACYKRPFGWHPASMSALQIRRGEVK